MKLFTFSTPWGGGGVPLPHCQHEKGVLFFTFLDIPFNERMALLFEHEMEPSGISSKFSVDDAATP